MADIFGYHIETIGRWIRRSQQGQPIHLPRGHRRSVFSTEELEQLTGYIESHPDITLREQGELFGSKCSLPALHKITRKIGYVFKKMLKASEQEREDIAKSHEQWKEFQTSANLNRLIFFWMNLA